MSSSSDYEKETERTKSPDRQTLLKNKPRRLRLPATIHQHYGEPSPSTPCSVFSFDLPNSPAVLATPRDRTQRALSTPAELPNSPTSIFNFDLLYTSPFEFGSQKTLRSSTSIPQTPITPATKPPPFLTLPTIEEVRASFSSTAERDGTEQLFPYITDWKSIRLIMVVILFTRIQFTTYFASLFPFMREVDPTSSDIFYSYISVSYSIGIAGAAPIFGKWSNKLGCIRKPSITSMWIMLATNFIYIFLHLVPFEARWAMLVARFLAGIAAGGNALLPTYWTYAAAEQDRSTAAALFDGAFCLGLAFGPGFQLLFAPLGYPGFSLGGVQVNMYTVPAMVSIVLVTITLSLMIFHFNEVPMPRKEKRGSIDSTGSSELSGPILPPYDKLAVALCIIGKMVQMFVYACMETIGPMYTQRMFNLDLSQTTKFNSTLVAMSGLLGFLFLLTYVWTKTSKKVDNRIGVLIGLSICCTFVLSTFPWPFYSEFIENNANGCEPWCATTRRIPMWLYAVAYIVVFGVGFALMNVHLAALYSSVLGPRRQGTMHGINTLLASCSRVISPLAITDMYKELGPTYVWLFQLSMWLLLAVALVVFYRRLVPCVPLPPPAESKTESK